MFDRALEASLNPAGRPLAYAYPPARRVPPEGVSGFWVRQVGFRLFVLLENRSSDVSSLPWWVRGSLVSWANNSVGTQSCPTPPGRPAGRPDPTRPWYVRVLDSTNCLHGI